jgi:hypothetical protein
MCTNHETVVRQPESLTVSTPRRTQYRGPVVVPYHLLQYTAVFQFIAEIQDAASLSGGNCKGRGLSHDTSHGTTASRTSQPVRVDRRSRRLVRLKTNRKWGPIPADKEGIGPGTSDWGLRGPYWTHYAERSHGKFVQCRQGARLLLDSAPLNYQSILIWRYDMIPLSPILLLLVRASAYVAPSYSIGCAAAEEHSWGVGDRQSARGTLSGRRERE